jgi:hypothetical protein
VYFSSQEIFLFAVLVPLLIFAGKKLRGEKIHKSKSRTTAEAGAENLSAEIRRKIENGSYREGESVLLASFESDVEANIVKGLLLDNDIYAELRDEILGATKFNYSYVVGGVKLFVHESERAQAEELLGRHREITQFEGKDWQPRVCPKCGSTTLSFQKFHPVSALILFLGAPFFPFRAGRWVCLSCSHKWKETKNRS